MKSTHTIGLMESQKLHGDITFPGGENIIPATDKERRSLDQYLQAIDDGPIGDTEWEFITATSEATNIPIPQNLVLRRAVYGDEQSGILRAIYLWKRLRLKQSNDHENANEYTNRV